MRAQMRLFTGLFLVGGLSSAAASESFTFWPGKGASKAPGFERMWDHPCGEVASAQVSKLPTASNGPLQSEVVVELDRRGNVIRRWPMPVDFTPHALRREELLVVAGDKGFWVRSSGSFRRATAIPATPTSDVGMFQCNLKSVFGKSDYAGCRRFVDLTSRKKRILGYQGVCS